MINSLNEAIRRKIDGTIYDRRRKLTMEQREEIRRRYKKGRKPSQYDLANEYGVSQGAIRAVIVPGASNRKEPYHYTQEEKYRREKESRTYKHKLLIEGKI